MYINNGLALFKLESQMDFNIKYIYMVYAVREQKQYIVRKTCLNTELTIKSFLWANTVIYSKIHPGSTRAVYYNNKISLIW